MLAPIVMHQRWRGLSLRTNLGKVEKEKLKASIRIYYTCCRHRSSLGYCFTTTGSTRNSFDKAPMKNKRSVHPFLGYIFLILLTPPFLIGQYGTGTSLGTVTDPTGAIIS